MKIIVFGAFVVCGILSHAQQNLLLNGSFESPAIATDSIVIATPTDWQGNSSVRIINGNYSVPDLIGPQDGQQYVSLGNDGTRAAIAQDFTITSAGTYELTWYDTVGNAPGFTSAFRVTVLNGASTVTSQDFLSNADAIWLPRTMSLNLSPGTYTLSFSSLQPSPGGASVQIDNVFLPGAAFDFAVSVPNATAISNGQLPFCSADTIHCEATTAIPSGNSVLWLIEPIDTTTTSSTYFLTSTNSGEGPTFDFELTSLNDWLNYTPGVAGYENRPTLSFRVTAALSDAGGNPVGAPVTKTIQQSDLGELRQEYVDFPVTGGVPNVVEFTSERPELNDGDYPGLALLTDWAVATAPAVLQSASSASPPMTTQVNTCYRNPVHHANDYLQNGVLNINAMNWSTQHLYGAAIDFQVGAEFSDPIAALDRRDYNRLKKISDQYGKVVGEFRANGEQRFDHVHLQRR